MKNKITRPDNYDTMSVEEKLKFFESFEYDDNSEAIQKLKDSVSAANSQAAEWKKKHNALLSEEEQAKIARDEENQRLREENEKLVRNASISEYTAKYTSLGYDVELAKSTAEAIANGDVVTVIANQATFNKNLENKIKAELIKDTPKPKTGENGSVTKEQFASMSYPERAKLYSENQELYNQLTAD